MLVALGDGVQHLVIGAPVIALCGTGAFAEECVVDARAVIPLPAQISREKLQLAAGLPVAFGTAHLALEVWHFAVYPPDTCACTPRKCSLTWNARVPMALLSFCFHFASNAPLP